MTIGAFRRIPNCTEFRDDLYLDRGPEFCSLDLTVSCHSHDTDFHPHDCQSIFFEILKTQSEPRFPEQRDALQQLLATSGLEVQEIAKRAGIRADTFRKYLGGYQLCGKQTMIA